ncbi:hypothetical protein G7Y89_g9865 [Cudoniella acicularis]|uniref:Glycosyltransferase family 17 protein n=1 Tax=Cudoniella acicularis TaxID=354080 RepID=A0A8H4W261_9HELO|nr:hypothetical protein G7Y89_g9865 [Cudoniella acicularis]
MRQTAAIKSSNCARVSDHTDAATTELTNDVTSILAQQFPPALRWFLKTLCYRWREVAIIIGFLWISLLYNNHKHPFITHPHAITPEAIGREFTLHAALSPASSHGFLPIEDATSYCAQHKWKPYAERSRPRKVYDLFMMNDELDWLEIRLHTLFHHIDYFVVLESNQTFTGLPKPLLVKENWARFAKFHEKIIYHEVEDMPVGATRTWDYEDHQRNAMFSQVIPRLEGIKKAEMGDVLMVSDVDEIPRSATFTLLRNCAFQKRLTLRSQFYYYGFQWLHRGEQWAHPQATIYAGPENTILPVDLRNGEGRNPLLAWWDKADLWNAGWHCSTCFGSINEVLVKMASFSHTGLNQKQFRNRTRIVDRVRNGLDLWDREGEVYDRVEENQDIPGWLKDGDNKERFSYLLNRDGPNAGFSDYDKGEPVGE